MGMFLDLEGKPRCKVQLHCHTTVSDGRKTPEEVLEIYRAAGFDAVALTDHWKRNEPGEYRGMTVLSGAEYNIGTMDGASFLYGGGVYHIIGIGCKTPPELARSPELTPKQVADAIHAAGGLVVLGHPAWSLNDPYTVSKQPFYDATEIYNTVSGVHHGCRPDSSLFVDLLACYGMTLPLLATDDAHYYDEDAPISWICIEGADASQDAVLDAVRRGAFYATQGPEVLVRREGDTVFVRCSPCVKITFFSNRAHSKDRVIRGENLTEGQYEFKQVKVLRDGEEIFDERFLRVEVEDADGKRAWSNFILR